MVARHPYQPKARRAPGHHCRAWYASIRSPPGHLPYERWRLAPRTVRRNPEEISNGQCARRLRDPPSLQLPQATGRQVQESHGRPTRCIRVALRPQPQHQSRGRTWPPQQCGGAPRDPWRSTTPWNRARPTQRAGAGRRPTQRREGPPSIPRTRGYSALRGIYLPRLPPRKHPLRRLWLPIGYLAIFPPSPEKSRPLERSLGNSRPTRHPLGWSRPLRILHRARVDQYPARGCSHTTVHCAADLAAGQSSREVPRAWLISAGPCKAVSR